MKFYKSERTYLLLFKSMLDASRCNHIWATSLEEVNNQIFYYSYHKNNDGDSTFIPPEEVFFAIKEIGPLQNWLYLFVIAGEKTGWIPIWKKERMLVEVKNERQ